MDDLYADAELYDLVAPPSADMERFYVGMAGGAGRSVLELACGSGRFTIPLAASGAHVTGGDLSETMLERARLAVAERGVAVELVRHDPVSQVSRADWYWSTSTRKDFRHTPLELRQIYPQELPLLPNMGGFRLEERFGDFKHGPMTAKSWRQVCVAVAA